MNNYINCITINTDASFDNKKKVGGYAFYIVCDIFKIKMSGTFKKQPKTSMQAEMMCIANAFYTLLTQKELMTTKLVVLNSDCIQSFDKIKIDNADLIGKKIAELQAKIVEKLSSKYIQTKFEYRHVKAHSNISDSRSLVNEWCDKEAKRQMRQSKNK